MMIMTHGRCWELTTQFTVQLPKHVTYIGKRTINASTRCEYMIASLSGLQGSGAPHWLGRRGW
jgi:hypothetical protein